jgi:hypothetical protein
VEYHLVLTNCSEDTNFSSKWYGNLNRGHPKDSRKHTAIWIKSKSRQNSDQCLVRQSVEQVRGRPRNAHHRRDVPTNRRLIRRSEARGSAPGQGARPERRPEAAVRLGGAPAASSSWSQHGAASSWWRSQHGAVSRGAQRRRAQQSHLHNLVEACDLNNLVEAVCLLRFSINLICLFPISGTWASSMLGWMGLAAHVHTCGHILHWNKFVGCLSLSLHRNKHLRFVGCFWRCLCLCHHRRLNLMFNLADVCCFRVLRCCSVMW